MQLKNVEACHYTLYSFCYLSFHFPFATTKAQLLPKQIFVGKFTPSSRAFTDFNCWTGQFSAKGAQGPQIASVFLALFTSLTDIGRSDERQFLKLGTIWKKSVCCCELRALPVQACVLRALYM